MDVAACLPARFTLCEVHAPDYTGDRVTLNVCAPGACVTVTTRTYYGAVRSYRRARCSWCYELEVEGYADVAAHRMLELFED